MVLAAIIALDKQLPLVTVGDCSIFASYVSVRSIPATPSMFVPLMAYVPVPNSVTDTDAAKAIEEHAKNMTAKIFDLKGIWSTEHPFQLVN